MAGRTYTDTEFEVTDKYFRAIAKIAFHYILKHFPNFRGDEEYFTAIRNFIMNGGNIQEYVTWSENQIIEQIKAGYTPTTFGHVIIARANQERIWSRLQFFLGPGSHPFVFKVAVANHKPALYYDITSGHQYCYNADGLKDGRIGVMDELTYLHKPATAGPAPSSPA